MREGGERRLGWATLALPMIDVAFQIPLNETAPLGIAINVRQVKGRELGVDGVNCPLLTCETKKVRKKKKKKKRERHTVIE